MRLIKLAIRSVLEWRRSVSPSVATVAIVSALVTVAGSVYEPITQAVHQTYRIHLGEYAGEMPADSADRLTRRAASAGALVSITSPPTAGTLDSIADLLLVRASFADLADELAFREMSASLTGAARDGLSAGDAVLLAGGPEAEALVGRVARLSTAGEPALTQILAIGSTPESGPELLVHAPERGGRVRVRLRGEAEPLDTAALQAAGFDVESGSEAGTSDALVATAWLERATERTTTLTRGVRILVLVLASLAVTTLVPGHLLLLDRAGPTLRLLHGWGFTPRDRGMLLVAMGGFASLVASAAGAALGLAVASIMNAGGTSALNLLPLDLADSLADTTRTVTPAVGWAGACVAASTLLGALTALPSARIAATLNERR